MMKKSSHGTGVTSKGTSSVCNQYLAAFTCSLLSFFYGHTVGWSSFAVPQFIDGILPGEPFTQADAGWVGGSLCLGAVISSPVYGLLANAKGRKFAAYVAGILFLVSWCIMVTADSLLWVLLARFVAGVGSAGACTIVTMYNNEIAEPRVKASLGGLFAMGYTVGLLFAYILGAWVPFTCTVVVYICLCALFFPVWWFMPETPAYLMLKGSEKEALRSLQWLVGSDGTHAQNAFNRLRKEQAGAVKPASFKEFFEDPAARKAIVLALILVTVLTFCGVFAVLSYASGIISRSGGLMSPTSGSMLFGCIMVLGSLLPTFIGDKMPRKVCLGISCVVLCAGMAVLGTMQLLQARGLDISNSWLGLVPIVVLSTTVFFHFCGLGSITYLAVMELFSDTTRGVAGTLIAIVMWFTSFLLLQFFGVAVEAFGDYSVFFFFSGVCAFGLFFVVVFIPELSGKTPDEIAAILTKR